MGCKKFHNFLNHKIGNNKNSQPILGGKLYSVIVLLILFGIILIGLVSAGTCNEDQRIMRLYQAAISTGNSHGALYNNSYYNINQDVCFSDIFGYAYTGPNDHTCHGNNRLINLYQTNNSHAAIPGVAGYNYGVCFGELTCRAISSGICDVAGGEKAVLSLFSNTNSHISAGDKSTYVYKICCKAFNVNNANWGNMANTVTANADLNDRVKLMVNGGGFYGKNFDFKIYKKGGFLSPDSLVYERDGVIGQSYSSAYATWRANVTGNYYFNVTTFDGKTYGSGILSVSGGELNSIPNATITNPKKGDINFTGDNIIFNQSSYDVDDYINYSWDFDDLTIVKGSTIDYVNYNLTHSYSIAGQKNINLSVIDERGLTDQDLVSILIINKNVNGKYVFAGITKPEYKKIITMVGDVEFDASDSYAVQVSGGVLSCLGGKCPASVPDPNGKKNDYSMFSFSWKFDDGTSSGVMTKPTYNRGFPVGNHFAKLEVTLDTGEKSNTIVIFTYSGGVTSQCQNGNTEWVENGIVYSTLEANGKCFGHNCCPTDYTCQGDSSTGQCNVNATCLSIPSCSNYTDSASCNNDKTNCNVAAKSCSSSSSGGNICGNSVGGNVGGSCKCSWDSSSGTCKLNKTIGINIEGISIQGDCSIDSIIAGECNDGQMVVTQHSTINWNYDPDFETYLSNLGYSDANTWLNENCKLSDCFSGTRMVVCDDNGIRLGFFSWFNALIAIIIIAFIYFIGFNKKE